MAEFHPDIWYRITSTAEGTKFSLDNDNDGFPLGFVTLSMQETGAYIGQLWQILAVDDSYQLCASWLGPD
jgi:hypothetical protein